MTPLPPPLGTGDIRFWRIDQAKHAERWSSRDGAFRVGGRWNPRGIRAVYASLGPSTACIEVAVHEGFEVLDNSPHVLTSARIIDPARLRIVMPKDVPNPTG